MTDVNMKEILMNFNREQNQMSGTRGLENNSNEQIFIMKINRDFRKQYELLFRNYYVRIRESFQSFTFIFFYLELFRTT
jgi:hypothetical protein